MLLRLFIILASYGYNYSLIIKQEKKRYDEKGSRHENGAKTRLKKEKTKER